MEAAWRSLRGRQPGAPLYRILWWHFLHFIFYCWILPCYRFRAWGYRNVPSKGPVLLVSNHQSYLDPIIVGLGSHHRQFFAIARSTLFRHPVFEWFIRSLNAIPVERGTADMGAMRRCIDVLNEGQALLIMPEGTRTLDGTTQPFAPGTMLIVKRAKPKVVPVAVEGAFAAWPKGRGLKLTGRIGVMYGEAIPAEKLMAMGADAALAMLRDEVEKMRLQLAEQMKPRREVVGDDE